jgi:hypothetical protein
MKLLRDHWRASWPHRYFEALEPIDRATALILLALATATIVAFAAIVRSGGATGFAPAELSAPPFELRLGRP